MTSVTVVQYSDCVCYVLAVTLDVCCVHIVQLNCCGATGPQDYMHSAWFNHTRDFTGVFVPSTCCHLLAPADPRRPRVKDENICQVEAIVIQSETDQPITQLHTKVVTDCITLSPPIPLRLYTSP